MGSSLDNEIKSAPGLVVYEETLNDVPYWQADLAVRYSRGPLTFGHRLFELQQEVGMYPADLTEAEVVERAKKDINLLSPERVIVRKPSFWPIDPRGLVSESYTTTKPYKLLMRDTAASIDRIGQYVQDKDNSIPEEQRPLLIQQLINQKLAFEGRITFQEQLRRKISTHPVADIDLFLGLQDRSDRYGLKLDFQGYASFLNRALGEEYEQRVKACYNKLIEDKRKGLVRKRPEKPVNLANHRIFPSNVFALSGRAAASKFSGNCFQSSDSDKMVYGSWIIIYENRRLEKLYQEGMADDIPRAWPDITKIVDWRTKLNTPARDASLFHEQVGHPRSRSRSETSFQQRANFVAIKEYESEIRAHEVMLAAPRELIDEDSICMYLACNFSWWGSDWRYFDNLPESEKKKRFMDRAYAVAGEAIFESYAHYGAFDIHPDGTLTLAPLGVIRDANARLLDDFDDAFDQEHRSPGTIIKFLKFGGTNTGLYLDPLLGEANEPPIIM